MLATCSNFKRKIVACQKCLKFSRLKLSKSRLFLAELNRFYYIALNYYHKTH